jgi:hypothetical protein
VSEEQRSSEEDVPWVARFADLVKCIDQGILALGHERNVEVDCRAIVRVTLANPVARDGIPLVLNNHVVPR